MSLGVLGALADRGPKLDWSGWLPMRQRRSKQFHLPPLSRSQGPSQAVSGRMQTLCQRPRKEGKLGASCMVLPRQHWLLLALEGGWGEASKAVTS